MKGKIIKIDDFKKSVDGQNAFKRVYFEMENGKWAKTDLVPVYRNYQKWKPFLTIGTELVNLKMLNETTVDADSGPMRIMIE